MSLVHFLHNHHIITCEEAASSDERERGEKWKKDSFDFEPLLIISRKFVTFIPISTLLNIQVSSSMSHLLYLIEAQCVSRAKPTLFPLTDPIINFQLMGEMCKCEQRCYLLFNLEFSKFWCIVSCQSKFKLIFCSFISLIYWLS